MNYPKEFPEWELACKCCGKCCMNQNFLNKLAYARRSANIPFPINSGYRCPKHNKEVGSTSQNHIMGHAVDIATKDSYTKMMIVASLIRAGFRRFGIYRTFVHVDDMNDIGEGPIAMW